MHVAHACSTTGLPQAVIDSYAANFSQLGFGEGGQVGTAAAMTRSIPNPNPKPKPNPNPNPKPNSKPKPNTLTLSLTLTQSLTLTRRARRPR